MRLPVILLLCSLSPALAADRWSRPLTDFAYMLDPSSTIEASEMEAARDSGQFQRVKGDFIGLGFQSGSVWFDLSVRNDSARDLLYLSIPVPVLDHLELYERNGESWTVQKSGDLYTREERNDFRNPTFSLSIKPGETRRYLLRIITTSAIPFHAVVSTDLAITAESESEMVWTAGYFGLLTAMILYNLFIYFSIRERSYLAYSVYVILLWMFQACNYGLAAQYILPNHPVIANYAYPILASLLALSTVIFTYTFHNVHVRFLKLRKVFWATGVVCILSIGATFYVQNRFNNALSIAISVLVLYTSVLSLMRGYRPALFFLAAWTGFVILTTLWSLSIRGIIQNFLIFRYAFLVGSATEVVILSLALGDRINLLDSEKRAALAEQIQLKTRLLDAFSRFVPRQFLRSLGKESPEEVNLGDASAAEVTILFSDIRGFTGMSERMNVTENFNFLNSYLKRMEPVIESRGGFVDKYIGDAIMAIFLGNPEHAIHAAEDMMKALEEYNAHRASQNFEPIKIGIGIHRGPVMLGTVGSQKRMDTTVIGDSVNACARIESLTKKIAPVLISEDALAGVSDQIRNKLKRIARVQVRGKTQSLVLYGFA